MTPLTQSRLSTALGLVSMSLGATACPTCGLSMLLAIPLAGVGFMMGRHVLAREDVQPESAAWSRFGLWSNSIGGVFSALATVSALLASLIWGASVWALT